MMKKTLAALAMATLLVPGVACAQGSFEYSFQSPYAGPHVLNVDMYQPIIEELKAESNGRLNLNFFYSGTMIRIEDALPSIMNGLLDFGGVNTMYQDTLFPYSTAFSMPHIARDSVQASAMFWEAYNSKPEIKAEWDNLFKVLTVWGSDRSGFFSTKGPILSTEDLQGKRVLVWSGGQVELIKAWGGSPVQVSSNETYMALQRGMGDVFFGPLPVGVAYKLMEVTTDITIFPASTIFIVNGMNWEVWNELPKDLQDLLESKFGGEAASIRSGQLLYDSTNRDLQTMVNEGCVIHTLTDAQYQAFLDADSAYNTDFWMRELARLGNPDPAGTIKWVFDLSAATPAAQ